MQTEHTHTLPT